MSFNTNYITNNTHDCGDGYYYIPDFDSRFASGCEKNCTFGTITNSALGITIPTALITFFIPLSFNSSDSKKRYERAMTRFNREVDTLRMLSEKLQNHPNIIRIFGFWDRHIVLDRGEADLMDVIENDGNNPHKKKVYSKRQIKRFLLDCFSATVALHSINWVHLDIKPENFVIVKNSEGKRAAKLIDFGSACSITERIDLNCMGTPEYLAPEIWRYRTDPEQVIADENLKKADCWSLGWVGILLLDKQLVPSWFQTMGGKQFQQSLNPVDGLAYVTSFYKTLPEDTDPLVKICRDLCVLNPEKRSTPVEALATLKLALLEGSK